MSDFISALNPEPLDAQDGAYDVLALVLSRKETRRSAF